MESVTREALVLLSGMGIIFAMSGCAGSAPPAHTPATGESSATAPATTAPADVTDRELFPDIVSATATQAADGTWSFDVTVSSPYDTPERYADGWRVTGADGTVFGEHPLTHDHASEQPFTRTQSGVRIPDDVTEVTIEGRDQVSGYGGNSVVVPLG